MNRQELSNIAIVILLIVVLGMLIYLLIRMKAEGPQCLIDPLQYYEDLKNTSCWCGDSFYNSFG